MLEGLLRWLGFGLCHQLPERSYVVSGLQASVCVRDTGIYLGFAIAFVLVTLLHKGDRPRNFPPAYVWAVMALLVAFMGWDGVTSYGGLRTTTNGIRLITGLGVGFSAAALVVPMLNDELWRVSSNVRVLGKPFTFAAWLVAIPSSWLIISRLGPLLGIGFPLLIAVGILFTLTAVNLVIVSMFPVFDRRADRIVQVVPPVLIALVLAFVEIALAAQLRGLLTGLASRL